MTLIDDYTKPSNILSYYEGLTISKKEYQYLKKLGQNKRIEMLKEKPNIDIYSLYKNIKTIRINSSIYPNTSSLNKEIILANAIFPNDIELIELLSSYEITLSHLKMIIRFRSILKNLLIYKKPLTKDLEENIIIYKKAIAYLINIFNKHYHFNDATIILNRLTELIITNSSTFEKIATDHKKLEKRI